MSAESEPAFARQARPGAAIFPGLNLAPGDSDAGAVEPGSKGLKFFAGGSIIHP